MAILARDDATRPGVAALDSGTAPSKRSRPRFEIDGTFHLLAKSDIERMEIQPKTLMPADYGSTLDTNELDDLVSYLLRAGDENARRTPTHSAKDDDDDN